MVHSSKVESILVTGGKSRFFKFLKNELNKYKIEFPQKKDFNILNIDQINKYINKKKFSHLIHIAGLSRPMKMHDNNISKSIDLNIIGTANIVKLCKKNKIKLIYFSTNYVYPGKSGNYRENDPLYPINNYAWSKLGGECSVHMYTNSLILRICMTDFPFVHKKAIQGAYSSFLYNKTVAKIIPYLLHEKGVLNIGGKRRDIYKFAKEFSKKKISKISINKIKKFPKDSSLNINKLKIILKKNKLWQKILL
jgi:dTDP-4-dehydrorhamnose reductase